MDEHIGAHRERGATTPSEAVRNTRRALQYQHGLLFFMLGVIALAAGLVAQYYPDSPYRWAVGLLLPLAWLALCSIERRRQDHGLWATETQEYLWRAWFRWSLRDPDPETVEPVVSVFLRITWQVIAGCTLALVIAFAIQWIGSGEVPKLLFFIMAAAGSLHMAVYGAWLAFDLRLAEHLLVICWFSAGASYVLTTQSGATVVYGGGLILLGILLHLRWIQFAGRAGTKPLAVESVQ